MASQDIKDTEKKQEAGEIFGKDISSGEFEVLDHSDEGQKFLQNNGFTQSYIQELLEDNELNKRLVHRIDWLLMPLLCGTYCLQYIDKSALSYGAVFDLLTNTHITSNEYSWLGSIFYFGYLLSEYPLSFAAQKWPTGKVVSGCIFCWGAMLIFTALSTNMIGLSICRFLLGVFEAPITPCFMMIVGMWYTRQEQPIRAGIFYSMNGIGSMIGGITTYAVGQEHTFPIWKAVFLLCGGLTVVWAIVNFWFLPDSIISARHFSLEQRALLVGRGQLGQTGVLNRKIEFYQIKETLVDPVVWILFLFTTLNEIVNGGIASFGKLIIKGIVQTPLLTVALGIPQGAFSVIFVFSSGYVATRFQNARTIVMALWILPTMLGTLLLWQLPRTNKIGLLFGYYIIGAYVGSLLMSLQMPSSNLGGYTKRVSATALVFLGYCIGNIIGPHTFLAKEAPTYPTGCKVIIACCCLQISLAIMLRSLLIRRNKARDARNQAITGESVIEDMIRDLTDFEVRIRRFKQAQRII